MLVFKPKNKIFNFSINSINSVVVQYFFSFKDSFARSNFVCQAIGSGVVQNKNSKLFHIIV